MEADNRTREAEKALGNAKYDAARAESVAGEAKGVAEKASEVKDSKKLEGKYFPSPRFRGQNSVGTPALTTPL